MNAVPELSTERLLLRGWRGTDFEPRTRLRADAEVMRILGGKGASAAGGLTGPPRGYTNGMTMNEDSPRAQERFERHEEEAAAEEAAEIGGAVPEYEGDEADRAVAEAGGGEAEGFELAEQGLEEAASHGEQRHNPAEDAFTPEQESDRSGAVYGEPDEVDSTEVVRDPDEDEDDPGEGPGLAAER